jgi:hypothetical protein
MLKTAAPTPGRAGRIVWVRNSSAISFILHMLILPKRKRGVNKP